MSAGKGDKPRKVDIKKYGSNYDRIFRKETSPAPKGEGSYVLRQAELEDRVFCFEVLESGMKQYCMEWNKASQYSMFKKRFDPRDYLIININGEDAGFACLIDAGTHSELEEIHLKEEYQNQGIGTSIINNFIKNTQKDIYLSVFKNNPAIRLYERLGFEFDDSLKHPEHHRMVRKVNP